MSDPFIGQIMHVGFNFAPLNWALCAGQTLQVSQNAALFSLLSSTFGGDGRTTFQLPNLQSRMIVGVGQGTGLSNYIWGQKDGKEQVTLNLSNLPTHSHAATFTPTGSSAPIAVTATLQAVNAPAGGLTAAPAAGSLLAQAVSSSGSTRFYAPAGSGTPVNLGGLSATATGGGITGGTVQVGNTGNGMPVTVLPPYLALTTIIALMGYYPPRD